MNRNLIYIYQNTEYNFIKLLSFIHIFFYIAVNVNRVDFDQMKKQEMLLDRKVCILITV